ncbi:4a-hydroxytetrahydrobiopterin dehydratase [Xylella fastidiosa]|uniref:Putative pterin-4-alpha-carbinolamine dehydratase n=4 Tax=Xylella fastidiosa TaxID=2371 RepID=PHS_XYLFM|nr:4a-hydroxytetrahydrobiopterin dehydratase [Xylella fastidiosa]B0U5V4.1 RecName: Full=Putative pterin-4-alpha-carbinolamine dehydratase; Short=PHS; AltName: Full=4-alpha-hydroxy-tetrahydropterin dehydratase; AltName: Full=Pterin carbinolamine dehydratase; Short=PCD [Xylella fastidiosa M12]ERI59549.1 pterin-4-alpha-carbinolamine dehydratase [Xylella fastidiosa subsp. multiplex Griffin-1]ACA13026.1 pterin-4-alpha-carbinolamine dehydratase [Xylella fastidiosa M12]AIC09112.1 pterin-4-alpha-carbin
MNDRITLAQAHCQPREKKEHKLGQARLAELLPQVPGWELSNNGHALTRTFQFDNYYRTLAFVNALAFIAHCEDHHPDMNVHYGRAVVCFSTHKIGGISEIDFICAAKTSALYEQGI